MKIRSGFVPNSSSSSFIMKKGSISKRDLNRMINTSLKYDWNEISRMQEVESSDELLTILKDQGRTRLPPQVIKYLDCLEYDKYKILRKKLDDQFNRMMKKSQYTDKDEESYDKIHSQLEILRDLAFTKFYESLDKNERYFYIDINDGNTYYERAMENKITDEF